MKYTETAAGGVICVSAAELCRRRPDCPLTAAEASRFAFLPGLRQNYRAEALVPYEELLFLVSCEAEGWLPQGPDRYATVTEFTQARSGVQSACPKPSDYALLCAAVLSAASDEKTVIRRVLLTPELDGTVSVCDDTFSPGDLALRLQAALRTVAARARFELSRAGQLRGNLRSLKFPFPALRSGQKELIETVYTAVRQKERLFAQAPTGIGKTVSVLYGTVRAMAGGSFRRIFYLTAKNSTRREAYAAACRLNEAGAGLRTAVLAAKDQMCPVHDARGGAFVCDGEACPYRKGYGPRAAGALLKLLEQYRGYPVSAIRKAAEAAGVCPYEFSLDLSEYCDIVICDYNSVFDPGVCLRRYFGYGTPEDCVLLVDEAHNLPARARDTFSAVLEEDALRAFAPFAAGPKLQGLYDALLRAFLRTRSLCAENSVREEDGTESGWYYGSEVPEKITDAAANLAEELTVFRFTHRTDTEACAAASALLRLCSRWTQAAASADSRFRTYIALHRGRLSVKLFCLDPSELLDRTLSRVRASVFFSATLTPADYYADILGSGKNAVSLSLPSPFPRENLLLAAVTSVDTRYEAREKSAPRICSVLAAAVSARRGNYLVFFPSYAYLKEVTSRFTQKYPKVRVRIQKPGMTRREREEFLSFFEDDTGVLRIGFCVLGGSFSEGIDLPGGRLIGTVIAGVGLPGLSAESNIIRDYYEERSECGFDYAYTYPGMNSVLQAAGRVIRRDTDTGAVILIDDRYATEKYRAMMPPHWDGIRYYTDLRSLQGDLGAFWGKPPAQSSSETRQDTKF